MNDPDADFYFDFSPDDIYVLYQCVCKRLEKWEGGTHKNKKNCSKLETISTDAFYIISSTTWM